ncbi:hypothetical protein ACF0H5_012532 [Mactra antiquata]
MGFGDSSLFLKIAFILLIVAFIIQILGVALPYWYELDAGVVETNAGLFKICSEVGSTKVCRNVKNPVDWWAATQAFEIIGLLIIIGALILAIVIIFVKSDMKILKLILWILCFCAFGFIIIGCIIFGAEYGNLYDDGLSGAFAICIINSVVCLVAGVLALLDWKSA